MRTTLLHGDRCTSIDATSAPHARGLRS